MPRSYHPKPGSVTKLCICGSRIQMSMLLCTMCWRNLPRSLQTAYLTARDGDCLSGPPLERAVKRIEDYVRKQASA